MNEAVLVESILVKCYLQVSALMVTKLEVSVVTMAEYTAVSLN
jgi:hypothetical protein